MRPRRLLGSEVVVDYPEAVADLHCEFIHAGSEVIQALTFWSTRNILKDQAGRGSETEKINRQAIKIAKQVSKGNALVAGTLSQTTLMGFRDRRKATHGAKAKAALKDVRSVLEEQARWLAEEKCRFHHCGDV